MLGRHHKELEHIKKINQGNEENMLRALTTDRKGMPKALRNESKTRSIMFKESLRIDLPVCFTFILLKIYKKKFLFRIKVWIVGLKKFSNLKKKKKSELNQKWTNTI